MGLLGRLRKRKPVIDDREGMVFGIGVDEDSLEEAREAGKEDGEKWKPKPNLPPPFIATMRARVTAAMRAKAAESGRTCEGYARQAWRLIEGSKNGNHAALRLQLRDFDGEIDEFDADVKTGTEFMHELESVYLQVAQPLWAKRQVKWRIEEFQVPEFLVEERAELLELKSAADDRHR